MRDDDVATRFGHATDVNVLGNDTGTGLTAAKKTDPKHGKVTCASDGTCTYTPDDGYSGSDGFVYTATDSGQRRATRPSTSSSRPAGAGYGIAVHGSPDPVGPGGQAQWGIDVSSMPGGITGDELLALALPATSATLGGEHAISGGSLQLAAGWSGDTDGGALHAKAGRNALLGEAATRTFPRPLPPISQGTGGDGHVPILVGSKVFAFYHHSHPTSVTCVDRATGDGLPGLSEAALNGFGTTNINGPAVVSGSKIYTHLQIDSGFTQSASVGLYCWDADTDSTCGLKIVARIPGTANPVASAPVLGRRQRLVRRWTTASSTASTRPRERLRTRSTPASPRPAAASSTASRTAPGCSSASSRRPSRASTWRRAARCDGWSPPKSFGGHWNVVNQHDTSGATSACASCPSRRGRLRHRQRPLDLIPDQLGRQGLQLSYANTQEAETGTRTLVGSLSCGGARVLRLGDGGEVHRRRLRLDGWLTQDDHATPCPAPTG